MSRPIHEIADVLHRFAPEFIRKHPPNSYHFRTLDVIARCRTASLGGHIDSCDCCGKQRISYNSCRNRHCPKCQSTKQAFWAEDRMNQTLPVKHFHIVFTVPEVLNDICLTDSNWFYKLLFAKASETLESFGYSHFGVQTGAICMLHSWGQNLSLHPHIHCIVPGIGLTISGRLKEIGSGGKYLYPVRQLSIVFRGKILEAINKNLKAKGLLITYRPNLDQAWKKPWVVHCEPSLASPKHVTGYLSRYTNRVAITNHRIVTISDSGVTFHLKDYRNNGRKTTTTLSGTEFLRRFCLHILPRRFVKVRFYGLYASRNKKLILQEKKLQPHKPKETSQERLLRLTGFDVFLCPFCKKGRMVTIEIIPRIRSPDVGLYPSNIKI